MTGNGERETPYIVDNFPDFITAVGTSGAYVEFPKNLVITSDTEIVEGKLYVDSTGEPITNPVTENLGNYYENTFVLDQNDYAPEGMTSEVTMGCKDFNGCGGKIDNIYFKSGKFKHTVSGGNANGFLRNVNFSNILIQDESSEVLYFNTTVMKCIFSARVSSASTKNVLVAYSSGQGILKNSSIYVESSSTAQIYICKSLGTADSKYNRIHLNVKSSDTSGLYLPRLDYSLVQGNCAFMTIANNSKYCVIDCEITQQLRGSGSYGSISVTLCLVNSDKVSGSINSGMTVVTTEQLTDAAYLSSIGFPIQT